MTIREPPILFSADMVRAVLDGSKTQTRRVAKFTAAGHVKKPRSPRRWHRADPDAALACPYGQPGDRLWVREAWRVSSKFDSTAPRDLPPRRMSVLFGAGGSIANQESGRWEPDNSYPTELPRWAGKLRPGIFLPRWASRITLELTGVRLERLNDISLEDVRAEGWPGPELAAPNPYAWFGALWLGINGPGSWVADPWVWALEFRRL